MKPNNSLFYIFQTSALLTLLAIQPITAKIIPDGTVNTTVTPTGNINIIEGGTRAGSNLFHSFQEFSLPTGREAFFNNAFDVRNIFSRVTGRSISNIDGLIRANGTANLFLLNPNGIIFGPNARLNIGGSFLATTANSFKFADGTEFSAKNPQTSPLLSINVPIGLQMGTNPGRIVNQANAVTNSDDFPLGLQVPIGNSIAFVGGDIAIEGGALNALSGRIELGGLAANGTVGLAVDGNNLRLNFPSGSILANVTLSNDARVSVRGTGGGDIVVNANNLTATNGGRLVAGSEGQGNAGDITVNANNISLSGLGKSEAGSGFYNQVLSGGSGNGGNIFVNTGSLSLTDGAGITSDTDGSGNGGNISIVASGNVSLAGNNTLIDSIVNQGAANAGNISIQAETVSLSDGAFLNASTFGQGNAGNILVQANGAVSLDNSNIFSSRVGTGAVGNSGNIEIKAGAVFLSDDASLDASTFGRGNAGSILVQASGAVSLSNSSIFSNVASGAEGNGGNITITAGSLSLTNGAQLLTNIEAASETQPAGRGNAGNIRIDVRQGVTIAGANNDGIRSAIFSRVGSGGVGNSGNIEIKAGAVSLSDDASLDASTFGRGDAGSILVQANGTVSLDNSTIFNEVNSGAEGNGGNITIAGGSLSLTNGTQLQTGIDAASETQPAGRGNAGNIRIDVRQGVTIAGANNDGIRSAIFSDVGSGAVGNGGNIDIRAGTLSMSDTAQITANTLGQGNAGSISVQTDSAVSLKNSSILSSVEAGGVGNGGNINIQAGSVSLTDGAQLVTAIYKASETLPAARGNAGNITIVARDTVTIAGRNSSDVLLPTALFSKVGSGAVGNGGNIDIQAGSFSLLDNATLSAQHFGVQGNAGSISIRARDSVSLSNSSISGGLGGPSFETVGKGGNISIFAGSLTMNDEASLQTSTFGKGNAGSVFVQAQDSVSLANSQISTNVASEAVGNGGDITIIAGSFSLTDGASLFADTAGKGNAGNISVQARNSVSIAGQANIFSNTLKEATGNGGSIDIQTGSLSLSDSAFIGAANLGGQGNSGSISVQARDSVSLANRSLIGTYVDNEAVGDGGDVNIAAGSFLATNNSAVLTITLGQGNAGNVSVQARDSVSFANGSFINTAVDSKAVGDGGDINIAADSFFATKGSLVFASTSGQGKAGDITIATTNTISFDGASGAFSTEEAGAIGNGGTIMLTGRSLFLTNESKVSVTSSGSKGAGSIEIDANSVRLDNSFLNAETGAGNQGNISVRTPSLILRRGSNITTNATGKATGGNIAIDTEVLAALENSDISANAEDNFGGQVIINAQGIFGTKFRPDTTPQSDITATSKLGPQFSGSVQINTPEVDPNSGLVNLPENAVDASRLVAKGCIARGKETGTFYITGTGGFQYRPGDGLTSPLPTGEVRSIPEGNTSRKSQVNEQIIEAQGVYKLENGEMVLGWECPKQ